MVVQRNHREKLDIGIRLDRERRGRQVVLQLRLLALPPEPRRITKISSLTGVDQKTKTQPTR